MHFRAARPGGIGTLGRLLFPIPFLLGVAMLVAAFWQNDADFVLGNAAQIDAVLVDRGPPHSVRGRPCYFPTFRLSAGQLLQINSAIVATELPEAERQVALRCSTRRPGLCKMPASPDLDPVFYGVAAVWTLLALAITWAMWGSLLRRARGRSQPGLKL